MVVQSTRILVEFVNVQAIMLALVNCNISRSAVKPWDKKKGKTSKLYRLTIVEEVETNDIIKVHYIEQDEWKSRAILYT